MSEIELRQDLVDAFAALTGDFSSLHMDMNFARKTQFRGTVVHGMLPVLLLLGRDCYEGGEADQRLKRIQCRFREPIRPEDRVKLSWTGQGDGRFEIARVSNGVVVTSGVIQTETEAGLSARSACKTGYTLLEGSPLDEARLLVDLAPGLDATLAFTPAPSAVRKVLRLADLQLGPPRDPMGFNDPNFAALLLVSTLIGMKMPGRFATFLDFSADFPGVLDPDRAGSLRATVAKIARAGEQLQLDLAWLGPSGVLASGNATTLARGVHSPSISCADLRSRHLDLGIESKVALVTGASRGIGQATAKLLAMHGAAVVVHYFKGEQDARETVEDILANGGRAAALGADLLDEAAIEELFADCQARFGGVDILVNNAVGDFTPKATDLLTREDYFDEFNVTLFGAHACSQRAIPHMKKARWGKIINLGTIATEAPVKSQSKYIVAKSALVGYTRSLAVELADHNVQVNMVVPGMTQTSLIASLPGALIERLAEDTSTGRLLQPIDVARAIAFLASDWSSPISGQQLVLNQGDAPFL